jgi:hypothetical protein
MMLNKIVFFKTLAPWNKKQKKKLKKEDEEEAEAC